MRERMEKNKKKILNAKANSIYNKKTRIKMKEEKIRINLLVNQIVIIHNVLYGTFEHTNLIYSKFESI